MKKLTVTSLLLSLCFAIVVGGPAHFVGSWHGEAIESSGNIIPFNMEVTFSSGSLTASMDIPSEGVYGLVLRDVELKPGGDHHIVSWIIPLPDGEVSCEGEMIDEESISGKYRSANGSGTFSMKRSE